MKIRTILATLVVSVAVFIGISAILQDRLSKGFIDHAAATQEALVRTSALQDDLRVLQIDFKWQVQAFKDILLRGKDPELLQKYKKEYDSNLNRVATEIEQVSSLLPVAEYSPIADTVRQLAESHKSVSAKYSGAIDIYEHLLAAKAGGEGLSADVAVRGVDRQLTADIDTIASFVRKQNEANVQAAAQAASHMHAAVASKVYAVAALLIALVVGAGAYAMRLVMSVLGAEPVVLRNVAESISNGDLTATIPAHDTENESSLASQLLLMQMKMRSLVIGIHEEAKGAIERARSGANLDQVVDDMRSLSKSMRRFKTSVIEEAR